MCSVFLPYPPEREICSPLIERKGLLSYRDGFGGRKLGTERKVQGKHGYRTEENFFCSSLIFKNLNIYICNCC